MSRGIAFAAITAGLSVLAPAAWAEPPAIPNSGTLTWSITSDVDVLPIGTPTDASVGAAHIEIGSAPSPC